MNPVPGVRLTLICRDTHTPYSGMLPGYVAGHYSYDDVHIDLSRLAEFAGARFYRDEAIGLDRDRQRVVCRNRPEVPYDLLSINIGSSPRVADVDGAEKYTVPVKPIHGFNQRWLKLLSRVENHDGPLVIAVVGAGAGGVELLLAMQYRLRRELRQRGKDPNQLHFHLFDAAADILPTHNPRVRAVFRRTLADRGVTVHLGSPVVKVDAGQLRTEAGQSLGVDEVLWVTRAGGRPGWSRLGWHWTRDVSSASGTLCKRKPTTTSSRLATLPTLFTTRARKPGFSPYARDRHWPTTSAVWPPAGPRGTSAPRSGGWP